ncbi:MAG: DUF732 domain-containing protein [Mycobacterium sp.]|uniref:DUF732 domain-containing protein n=1 Tax=Mycobacterium sp. TaxID=1785 RepID=UPI003C6B9A65
MLKASAAGLAALAAGIVLSAVTRVPAWADPDADAAYLNALHRQGIQPTSGSDASLIAAGHEICEQLAAGYSMNAVMAQGEIYAGHGITEDDVKVIVRSAAAAYCPQYIP